MLDGRAARHVLSSPLMLGRSAAFLRPPRRCSRKFRVEQGGGRCTFLNCGGSGYRVSPLNSAEVRLAGSRKLSETGCVLRQVIHRAHIQTSSHAPSHGYPTVLLPAQDVDCSLRMNCALSRLDSDWAGTNILPRAKRRHWARMHRGATALPVELAPSLRSGASCKAQALTRKRNHLKQLRNRGASPSKSSSQLIGAACSSGGNARAGSCTTPGLAH